VGATEGLRAASAIKIWARLYVLIVLKVRKNQ